MRKTSHAAELTRANMTKAFWDLYMDKPIEKITIREITDHAGYNRATFYLYYRDVYDLFEQIEDDILDQVRALVQDRLLAGDTLDFTQHMGLVLELAQRFDGYLPRLMSGDPSFGDRLKEIIAPLLDRFILPESGLSEAEQGILREFYLSGLLGAIVMWMNSKERMSIDRLIGLVVGAVLPQRSGGQR